MKQTEIYVIFHSIHHVLKAERLIKSNGLPCDLVPTPREISSDCGMALVVAEDIYEAVETSLGLKSLEFNAFRRSGYTYQNLNPHSKPLAN